MDLWKYLGELPDKTKYITNLIDNDRVTNGDPKFIDTKIKDLQKQIQDLEDLKKQARSNSEQVKELLDKYYGFYKDTRTDFEDHVNVLWLNRVVLPKLKKLGAKDYNGLDVLNIFKTRYKEENVERIGY